MTPKFNTSERAEKEIERHISDRAFIKRIYPKSLFFGIEHSDKLGMPTHILLNFDGHIYSLNKRQAELIRSNIDRALKEYDFFDDPTLVSSFVMMKKEVYE